MSTTEGSKDNDDWVNNYTPMDLTNPETPHDRVLVVGEKKFYVNTDHLSLYSEYFKTMFNSNFKEKNEVETEIKDVDAEKFHDFLKLMHPCFEGNITRFNYLSLLEYSRYFLAREAFTICEKFVLANFDKLDKIDLLKIAFDYSWTNLKDKLSADISSRLYTCPNGYGNNQWGQKCLCVICRNDMKGPIVERAFFIRQKDQLALLPAEVQSFVYQNLFKNTK